MASVNQAQLHCVNQMGKTNFKPSTAWHGKGTAWARHATCESAFNGETHGCQQLLGCWILGNPSYKTLSGWTEALLYSGLATGIAHSLRRVYTCATALHIMNTSSVFELELMQTQKVAIARAISVLPSDLRVCIWFTSGSYTHSDTCESSLNTGCFKKSFTTLKAYWNLYRGHTQRFELSKCSKTHWVLPRIVIHNCFDLFFRFLLHGTVTVHRPGKRVSRYSRTSPR
jgi:hypothetical protein